MLFTASSSLAALIALLAPGVASAESTRYVDLLFDDVVVTPDVVYGEAVNSLGALQELKLDVYQPKDDTETGRALYVWVHGGNFRGGSKSGGGPLRDYGMRGWVGISIDYRVRPELPGNAAIGALTQPASLPAFIDARDPSPTSWKSRGSSRGPSGGVSDDRNEPEDRARRGATADLDRRDALYRKPIP